MTPGQRRKLVRPKSVGQLDKNLKKKKKKKGKLREEDEGKGDVREGKGQPKGNH